MTPRFALICPRVGPSATRSAAESIVRLHAGGLAPYPVGRATLMASSDACVVGDAPVGCALVGTAFRERRSCPVDAFEPGEANAIAASRGDHALKHFWGNFIVLFDCGGTIGAVRDPGGAQAAYHVRTGAFDLLVSDLATATTALGRAPALDWAGVAHDLRFAQFRGSPTGLSGITELCPGERLLLGREVERSLAWRVPLPDPDVSLAEAEDHLREAVVASVDAWVAAYPHLQLELSGGLDSSILAACLARSGDRWRAATLVAAEPRDDERGYALVMAAAAGAPLVEVRPEIETYAPGERIDMRPRRHGLLASIDHALGVSAESDGADAIMTGAGGDTLFGALGSSAPIVDAWRDRGAAFAWRTAIDLARIHRISVWASLASTARRMMRRGTVSGWPSDDRMLEACAPEFAGHPWLAHAGALPGHRAHVAGVLSIMPYLDAFERGRARPFIAPLMARPVIEACLAIPSWRLSEGGRDRAIARRAFAQMLPPAIVNRRAKGRFHSIFAPSFDRSRARLRDLLLGGRLAAERVIDAGAVEQCLSRPLTAGDTDYVRAGDLADVELWVRGVEGLDAPLRA